MTPAVVPKKGGGLGALLNDPKKRRTALLVLGGVVALIFIIRSRQAPAADDSATAADQSQAGAGAAGSDATGQPSTFADNGAQAAQLGDSVTSGLQGVATALTDQGDAFSTIAALLQEPAAVANTADTGNPTTTPASPPAAGTTFKPSAAQTAVSGVKVPSDANKRAWSADFRKRYAAAGGDQGYIARQLQQRAGVIKSAAPPALPKPKPKPPPAKAKTTPAKQVGSGHNAAPKPAAKKPAPKPVVKAPAKKPAKKK